MLAFRWVVALVFVVGVAGCGSDSNAVMPDVTGKRLDVAQSDIKRAGFDDDVEVLGGGAFGVVDESNWEVCEQVPASGATVTTKPRLTVERKCEDDASEEPSETASAEPLPTESEAPVPEEPAEPAILTSRNNAEFAKVLKVSDGCDSPVGRFASKYAGKTIQFNGSIADLAPHGDYDTRFDILVYPGDKGPESTVGPAFKFEDENLVSDMNFTGKGVPEYIRAGDRYQFVAKVGEYRAQQCILFLEPVETKTR